MKLSIVTLLTFLSFSSLGQAAGLPRVIESKIEQMAMSSAKSVAAQTRVFAGNSCVDFSGKYAGTCTAGDKREDVSFTLAQEGCKSLKIDEDTIQFGTHGVLGGAPEQGTFVSASWNQGFAADGQAIVMNVGFTADLLNYNLPIGGRVYGKAHKNGNDLVIRGLADIWMAENSIAKVQIDCSLQKQ